MSAFGSRHSLTIKLPRTGVPSAPSDGKPGLQSPSFAPLIRVLSSAGYIYTPSRIQVLDVN